MFATEKPTLGPEPLLMDELYDCTQPKSTSRQSEQERRRWHKEGIAPRVTESSTSSLINDMIFERVFD